VSRHRKVVINRLKSVIEKRLKEKAELGDNYKSYASNIDIIFLFFFSWKVFY